MFIYIKRPYIIGIKDGNKTSEYNPLILSNPKINSVDEIINTTVFESVEVHQATIRSDMRKAISDRFPRKNHNRGKTIFLTFEEIKQWGGYIVSPHQYINSPQNKPIQTNMIVILNKHRAYYLDPTTSFYHQILTAKNGQLVVGQHVEILSISATELSGLSQNAHAPQLQQNTPRLPLLAPLQQNLPAVPYNATAYNAPGPQQNYPTPQVQQNNSTPISQTLTHEQRQVARMLLLQRQQLQLLQKKVQQQPKKEDPILIQHKSLAVYALTHSEGCIIKMSDNITWDFNQHRETAIICENTQIEHQINLLDRILKSKISDEKKENLTDIVFSHGSNLVKLVFTIKDFKRLYAAKDFPMQQLDQLGKQRRADRLAKEELTKEQVENKSSKNLENSEQKPAILYSMKRSRKLLDDEESENKSYLDTQNEHEKKDDNDRKRLRAAQ